MDYSGVHYGCCRVFVVDIGFKGNNSTVGLFSKYT